MVNKNNVAVHPTKDLFLSYEGLGRDKSKRRKSKITFLYFYLYLCIHLISFFRLWEVLWTSLPCANFHLLICVAILDAEKDILISKDYGFTEILKVSSTLNYYCENFVAIFYRPYQVLLECTFLYQSMTTLFRRSWLKSGWDLCGSEKYDTNGRRSVLAVDGT